MNESLAAVVFSGPPAQCREFALVLEATGIEYELVTGPGVSQLVVPAERLHDAYEQLGRYSLERRVPRPQPAYQTPRPGALYGAALYVVVLLFVAYAAGVPILGADWFAIGALDSSPEARHQIWRWLTALTLHADPQHLLSNLLSGLIAGIAVARLIGPGSAWAMTLLAAAFANGVEMAVSPPLHRAIGASTAVFAALGLISGLAFMDKLRSRERRWRRWAPVLAGCGLLALTGSGGADPENLAVATHVDVLGHLLGFAAGLLSGVLFVAMPVARMSAAPRGQGLLGITTLAALCAAWGAALLSR